MLKKRVEAGSLHLLVQPIFPQSRDSKAQPTAIACHSPNTPPATRPAAREPVEVVVEPAVAPPPPEEKTESERLSEIRDIVLDDSTLDHPQELSVRARLERFVYLADERCIWEKYVAGEKVL